MTWSWSLGEVAFSNEKKKEINTLVLSVDAIFIYPWKKTESIEDIRSPHQENKIKYYAYFKGD